jgi:hypothetical protein
MTGVWRHSPCGAHIRVIGVTANVYFTHADLSELPASQTPGRHRTSYITILAVKKVRSLALITRDFQLSAEVAKESSDQLIKQLCMILGGS